MVAHQLCIDQVNVIRKEKSKITTANYVHYCVQVTSVSGSVFTVIVKGSEKNKTMMTVCVSYCAKQRWQNLRLRSVSLFSIAPMTQADAEITTWRESTSVMNLRNKGCLRPEDLKDVD